LRDGRVFNYGNLDFMSELEKAILAVSSTKAAV
jgi:hypothetical protein